MIVVVAEYSEGSGPGKAYVVDTEKMPRRGYAKALEDGGDFIQIDYEDSIEFGGERDNAVAMVDLPAVVEQVRVVWIE